MDNHRADRHEAPADARSLSEILADARDLQLRHAPCVLGAATSWLRNRVSPRAGGHSSLVARLLVVH